MFELRRDRWSRTRWCVVRARVGDELGGLSFTLARAEKILRDLAALPDREQRLIAAGHMPLPGCVWLIGGGRESRGLIA